MMNPALVCLKNRVAEKPYYIVIKNKIEKVLKILLKIEYCYII